MKNNFAGNKKIFVKARIIKLNWYRSWSWKVVQLTPLISPPQKKKKEEEKELPLLLMPPTNLDCGTDTKILELGFPFGTLKWIHNGREYKSFKFCCKRQVWFHVWARVRGKESYSESPDASKARACSWPGGGGGSLTHDNCATHPRPPTSKKDFKLRIAPCYILHLWMTSHSLQIITLKWHVSMVMVPKMIPGIPKVR